MTNLWSRRERFTHIKEKRTNSSLRGSIPSEHIKKIDQEAHVPTLTEADENQFTIDHESLEKDLR